MFQVLDELLLAVLAVLGIVKVVDITILVARDRAAQARVGREARVSQETRELPLSPSYSWAKNHRFARALVLWGFRLPVLTTALSLAVLAGGDDKTVRLVSACVDVGLAIALVLGIVSAYVMDRRWRKLGWRFPRDFGQPDPGAEVPLAARPLVAIAFALAFAALYHALYRYDTGSFAVAHGSLGPVSSVYFSVVTSATVGYGDIQPRSQGGQLVVTVQIVSTVAALAVLASRLLTADPRGEDYESMS